MDTCVPQCTAEVRGPTWVSPSPTTLFEVRASHFITMNAIYSGSYWVRIKSLLCQLKWLKSWRSQNTANLEVGFAKINSSLLKNIDFVSNNNFPKEKHSKVVEFLRNWLIECQCPKDRLCPAVTDKAVIYSRPGGFFKGYTYLTDQPSPARF